MQVQAGVAITSFAAGDPASRVFAFGLEDGTVIVGRHDYRAVYSDDGSTIHPEIDYPLGGQPMVVDDRRRALLHLAVQSSGDETTITAAAGDSEILLSHFVKKESFLSDDEPEIKRSRASVPLEQINIRSLLLTRDQQTLYVVGRKGSIAYFDIRDKAAPQLLQRINVTGSTAQVTSVDFLAGDISLLVGDSSGRLAQWFPVRDERNNHALMLVREFH